MEPVSRRDTAEKQPPIARVNPQSPPCLLSPGISHIHTSSGYVVLPACKPDMTSRHHHHHHHHSVSHQPSVASSFAKRSNSVIGRRSKKTVSWGGLSVGRGGGRGVVTRYFRGLQGSRVSFFFIVASNRLPLEHDNFTIFF
ncbi:hypothetical protein IF1G_02323 [Cordyceps javanica]|uniref:Uncharacterized protein n=1 Tax=Cordyceps javanica TaxID=43265 RepID=A0A545V947_9HYPO|nr:hypothetical protein IF1G_02323 [Cordyceps javanica]